MNSYLPANLTLFGGVRSLTVFIAICFLLCPRMGHAEPEAPQFQISGNVRDRGGNAVLATVLAQRDPNVPEAYYDETDANGDYLITGIPLGTHVLIYVRNPSDYFEIRVSPASHERTVNANISGLDFTVTPAVEVDVNCGSWLVNPIGVEVFSGGTRVATVPDNGLCATEFFPDDFGLPYSGTLWLARPFYRFMPQDDQHIYYQYDCAGKTLTPATLQYTPSIQTPFQKTDVPATYTWDSPGGLGWRAFPATPDNRLPNNPSVFVEADIWTSGTLSRDKIRLVGPGMTAGIPSSVDLTKENGHVAEFEYPINGCNRRELRVQVLFQYGYSNQWVDLPGYAASGTSNGDLSVDGYIDLEDMGILAGTMYLCEGPGFVACADYEPDGCVDLQDLGAFAEILYAAGDKSERRDGVAAEAELIACTGIAQDCIVSADTAWKSALIRLRTTGADPQQLGWSPSERYLDRSLMVVNETAGDGEFGIFVVASGDSGLTNIGQLIASTSADLKGIEVLGVEVASAVSFEKSVGGIAPSAALLADACPNPFNPLTRITFELPFADQVSLSVYDIAGRLVRRLVDNQTLAAGSHVAEWDGRNGDGGRVAGGMYLYRLESPSFNLVKRMTMLK